MTTQSDLSSYSMSFNCIYCHSLQESRQFVCKDLMYSSNHRFLYYRCSSCFSLQISTTPPNLQSFYPSTYSPFSSPPLSKLSRNRLVFRLLTQLPHQLSLAFTSFFNPDQVVSYIASSKLSRDTSILEVGCGAASGLMSLHSIGFTDLTGTDCFIDPQYLENLPFHAFSSTLPPEPRRYDVIMLNHVFEHLEDPFSLLCQLQSYLSPNGVICIFCPLANSFASYIFDAFWIQLDPPRHLNIPSTIGFRYLAARAGYESVSMTCNSTSFQFMGSVQALCGIPLLSSSSIYNGSILSKSILALLTPLLSIISYCLNLISRGDQARFIIRSF